MTAQAAEPVRWVNGTGRTRWQSALSDGRRPFYTVPGEVLCRTCMTTEPTP